MIELGLALIAGILLCCGYGIYLGLSDIRDRLGELVELMRKDKL